MLRKPDPSTLLNRIIAACSAERGMAMGEIMQATQGHPPSVSATVPQLVHRGLLHRVGTRMLMRYFAHAHHAQAYTPVFKEERAAAALAKKERAKDRARARYAANRQTVATVKPKTPPKPKKPRTPRARPPREPVVKVRKFSLEQLPPTATVTWPAHVQVQRAPVCRDTRFTFTPPEGWVGEFGKEWQERRGAA